MSSIHSIENRAFWAMNLNMATNNLMTIIQYIDSERPQDYGGKEDKGINGIQKSGVITKLKDHKESAAVKITIIRKLMKTLPFIATYRKLCEEMPKNNRISGTHRNLETIVPEKLAELLLNMAKKLYELRNYYSHKMHADYTLFSKDSECEKYLDMIFDASIRTVKDRFYKDKPDREVEMLLDQYRRYKGIEKNNHNPNFKCHFFNKEEDHFTEIGLAFFVSMFLESKYTDILIKSPHFSPLDFKLSDKDLFFRIFSIHSVRLPRPRIASEMKMTAQTLGMDILNELHKCPNQLFELLSPEDQQKFRQKSDDQKKEILYKRFGDRFPILCLNYFDYNEVFKRLRFQIDMGKYWFKSYPKNLIDGSQMDQRRLGKRTLVFERIQDVVNYYETERQNRHGIYQSYLPNESRTVPFMSDMCPRYFFREGPGRRKTQIGIGFVKENRKFDGPKIRNNKPKKSNLMCWLSVYELPIMAFLVNHGQAENVENKIQGYCETWKNFLKKIEETGNVPDPATMKINLADIPEELRYYKNTGKIKPYSSGHIGKFLDEQIERTQRMLDNVKNENQYTFKPGKAEKRRFTPGRIASLIAHELIMYQPANMDLPHQGKLTAPNFQALQSSLAMFDTMEKPRFIFFRRTGLIENPAYPHPFLNIVLSHESSSIVNFFLSYLDKKKMFLVNLRKRLDEEGIEKLQKDKDFYIIRNFIRRVNKKNRTPQEHMISIARQLLRDPVNLPRNLFAELVKKVVAEEYPEQFEKLRKSCTHYNATFLMMKYHEWSNKGMQWFYKLQIFKECKKYKKLFKMLHGPLDNESTRKFRAIVKKLPETEMVQVGKTEKLLPVKQLATGLLNKFDHVQKDLRHERLRDIVLMEQACNLLKLPELQLADIQEHTGTLNEQVLLNTVVTIPKGNYFYIKNKYHENEDIPRLECTIYGIMKRKNFGNFRRITNDLRFPSHMRILHDLFNKTEVNYKEMEDEFDCFDRKREEIFQYILRLEDKVLRENLKLQTLKKKDRFMDFVTICQNVTNVPAEQLVLIIIRNAFAHSYYPEFNPTDETLLDWTEDEQAVPCSREYFKRIQEEIRLRTGENIKAQNEAPLTKAILEVVINILKKILAS